MFKTIHEYKNRIELNLKKLKPTRRQRKLFDIAAKTKRATLQYFRIIETA